MKDLCQEWKVKLSFRGAYRLSGTAIVERLEIVDVGCNLKQFDGLTWLTLTPVYYDWSTPMLWNVLRKGFHCPRWVIILDDGGGGYWRQWADERLGDPPPRCIQEPLVVWYWLWKTPKRTPWQCTASVCVALVHCWEMSG